MIIQDVQIGLFDILFFVSLVICFYVYFGYPLLLTMLGFVFRRSVRKGDITPFITVIIAAHNEEHIISDKLENTLSLDYPNDRLEIIVASDGSTDQTESIVIQYRYLGVLLLSLPRCGKAMALNIAMKQAKGEVIVFTDANSILEVSALGKLVSNFSDPNVGGVCGNQKYLFQKNGGDSTAVGENLYWSYDKWIKGLESKLHSIVAADGSIYAIRKHLYVPILDLAQADDFAISARIVTQGYRLVYESEAISYENPPSSSDLEFWRKVRVANQSINVILNLRTALNPFQYGFYSFTLISHKVLRYFVPFVLIIAFLINFLLAFYSEFYKLIFLGQIVFYVFALIGYKTQNLNFGRMRILYGPFYFCLANIAVLVGAIYLFCGKRITTWQPERE